MNRVKSVDRSINEYILSEHTRLTRRFTSEILRSTKGRLYPLEYKMSLYVLWFNFCELN